MRKIIGLLLLLTQFSCAKHAQDHLTLKIQYLPEKTYHQTMERNTQTVTKFSGSEKSLQTLKKRGVQNPTITNKKSKTETVLKTGKRNGGNNFPVTLEYLKTLNNNDEKVIPDGTIFQGICIGANLPRINSIVSDKNEIINKTAALQLAESTFTQLTVPEKEFKIGDQFSVEYPTSFPMERSKIEMIVTSTYKLNSISNEIASFDVSLNYSMNPVLLDNSFVGNGSGKGTLTYDMANTIILNYTMNTDLEINKKLDSFDFNLKTKSEVIQTTTISKNQND